MEHGIDEAGKAWYSTEGKENDVVLSSRLRLCRNLANFPFPERFRGDDENRVQAIIMDALRKIPAFESYRSIETSLLSPLNRRLLEELGVIKSQAEIERRNIEFESLALMNREGNISAVINGTDHLKLSAFSSGLDYEKCFNAVKSLDADLEKSLQFAATYDLGYLTSALKDTGSGMKISARLSLPATLRSGKIQAVIDYVRSKKAAIIPAFPQASLPNLPPPGSYFLLFGLNAANGSEIDQIAEMESISRFIAEYERKILLDFADNHTTIVRNFVLRSYSTLGASLLLSLREALDIISDLQVGLRLSLLDGIDGKTLAGLLYRIQDAHLTYLLEKGKFNFPDDIKDERRQKLDRLRAVVLQDALENISLRKL